MTSISRGFGLLKQSWAVLKLDKELMLFPVLSGGACLLVMASFALPFIVSEELRNFVLQAAQQQPGEQQAAQAEPAESQTAKVVSAIVGFTFYLVNYFVIVFFNTALAALRDQALQRRRSDRGLRPARSLLAAAADPGLALLAATVGYLLRAIEERLSIVGRLVVGLIGVAWSVVTYLVVPVLAVERVGPFPAVRRSAELLTKSWGPALVGNLSLGLAGFLLSVPGILLLLAAPIRQRGGRLPLARRGAGRDGSGVSAGLLDHHQHAAADLAGGRLSVRSHRPGPRRPVGRRASLGLPSEMI